MKKHVFLLAFLAVFSTARGIQLSDSAQISLLTVAPGEEVYSLFGHSALRVFDPKNGIDQVYNWGTFDFETPGFLLKFCRGKLLYFMNVENERRFEMENLRDRRAIEEQHLNLTAAQKQRLAFLLTENARPENRFYKYDFFFDNCSTRIRDLIDEAFFHQINFDSTAQNRPPTLRKLLKLYLKNDAWTEFGIDLVLGLPADKKTTAENSMFLPDFLHDEIGGTKIDSKTPLVASETRLPTTGFEPENEAIDWLTHPLTVMWFVFGLGLLSIWSAGFQVVFDKILWFSLGLAGLVIFLLWFFTDHLATKNNFNLFWALPTHLFFFWRKAKSSLAEFHSILAAILAALMIVFWKFMPQQLPMAALPLALLVVIKGITNFRRKQLTVV